MEKQVNFSKRQLSHLFQHSHPSSQVIIMELTFCVIRKEAQVGIYELSPPL